MQYIFKIITQNVLDIVRVNIDEHGQNLIQPYLFRLIRGKMAMTAM